SPDAARGSRARAPLCARAPPLLHRTADPGHAQPAAPSGVVSRPSSRSSRQSSGLADHWELCSAWWSRTIRTARARTSGEYGGTRFVMAPSSQESEPPENPVRFSRGVGALPHEVLEHARPLHKGRVRRGARLMAEHFPIAEIGGVAHRADGLFHIWAAAKFIAFSLAAERCLSRALTNERLASPPRDGG